MQLSFEEKLKLINDRYCAYVSGEAGSQHYLNEALLNFVEHIKQADFYVEQQETEVNTANWHVQLTKEEYYFLCILVGHLVPNNGITGSLLDKFSLDLEANDYDRLEFKINVVNNQADVQMKLNEFNLENK